MQVHPAVKRLITLTTIVWIMGSLVISVVGMYLIQEAQTDYLNYNMFYSEEIMVVVSGLVCTQLPRVLNYIFTGKPTIMPQYSR